MIGIPLWLNSGLPLIRTGHCHIVVSRNKLIAMPKRAVEQRVGQNWCTIFSIRRLGGRRPARCEPSMTDLSNLPGPSDAEAADRSYIALPRQIHAILAAGALEAGARLP